MITLNVQLQPFQVPNYVIQKEGVRPREESYHEAPRHRLADVDAETLARLCDEFRATVFEKAGKTDPRHEPNYPTPRRNDGR